ncbi:unnamed protein product [Notodromas monacha]|uniref:2'-phosphotransferase n=1 Tax=Notodromas monacha TaxID=399045 RepID=A0A7R9BR57_9CRUS|nr:unnamed protein product [Notodromas monacha]CAG0919256.1 unnamed protein product [Notodromas monacha]
MNRRLWLSWRRIVKQKLSLIVETEHMDRKTALAMDKHVASWVLKYLGIWPIVTKNIQHCSRSILAVENTQHAGHLSAEHSDYSSMDEGHIDMYMNDAEKELFRMTSSDVKLSKTMSWLLRHGALKVGVRISSDGFVRVGDILSRKEFAGCTMKDVQRIVEMDNGLRFCLRERCGTYEIKAYQGHSIRVEDLELLPVLSKEEIAGELVHGTYETKWEKIKEEGICYHTRNQVHMGVDSCAGKIDEGREIPGIRSSSEILIYIDLEAALRMVPRRTTAPSNDGSAGTN